MNFNHLPQHIEMLYCNNYPNSLPQQSQMPFPSNNFNHLPKHIQMAYRGNNFNNLPPRIQMLYCGNNFNNLPPHIQMLYCTGDITCTNNTDTNFRTVKCYRSESDKLRKQRNTEKTHLFLCLKYLQCNFVEQGGSSVPPLPNEMIMHIINFV